MLSIALNVLTGWEILVGKNISNNYKKDLTMKTQISSVLKKTVERLKYPWEIHFNAMLTVKQYTNTNTSHMLSKQESINSD